MMPLLVVFRVIGMGGDRIADPVGHRVLVVARAHELRRKGVLIVTGRDKDDVLVHIRLVTDPDRVETSGRNETLLADLERAEPLRLERVGLQGANDHASREFENTRFFDKGAVAVARGNGKSRQAKEQQEKDRERFHGLPPNET